MAKYSALYNKIQKDIEEGILKPGERLPSEKELMETYDLSRDTVRKSLGLLAANSYIRKIKGKGSFVLEMNRFDFPVAGLISFKEMAKRTNMKSHYTEVVRLHLLKESAFPVHAVEQNELKDIWELIRVRVIDGRRVILDKDYFYKDVVGELTEDVCKGSIYEYFENELGITIGHAHKEIIIEKATEEDKRNLDLQDYDVVAVVNSLVYLETGKLFQFTQSRHCPDKFRFIDVARRVRP
ncbi:MAG: trehalose operon repressor [Clostridia bacterium]|jgi:GntR family trehalose operon transcriptional repressor|nr:trehalose operon repressor [Clostridia bacterium]